MTYPGNSAVQYAYDAANCGRISILSHASVARPDEWPVTPTTRPAESAVSPAATIVNARITYNGYVSPPNITAISAGNKSAP